MPPFGKATMDFGRGKGSPIATAALVAALVVLGACGREDATEAPEPSRAPPAGRAEIVVLGDVEANLPIRRIRWIQPLADLLAARLADHGIRRGRVVVASDLRQMAGYLRDGTVDVYLDSPLPSLAVRRLAGSEVVLRRLVDDQRVYWSVFVSREDEDVRTLDDLRGRVIAFQEEHSTTGYLLPAHFLREEGYQLKEVKGPRERVGPHEVGYFFSGDEENTIDMLRTGRVVAGAISSQDLDALPGELQRQVRILARTQAIPRQLVSVRPGLDPGLVRAVRDILLGLTEEDREGLAAAVQGGGWTWVFEDLSDETVQQLEGFGETVDTLLRIEE